MESCKLLGLWGGGGPGVRADIWQEQSPWLLWRHRASWGCRKTAEARGTPRVPAGKLRLTVASGHLVWTPLRFSAVPGQEGQPQGCRGITLTLAGLPGLFKIKPDLVPLPAGSHVR